MRKIKYYFWVGVAIVLLKVWASQFPVMRKLEAKLRKLREEYCGTV